MNKYLKFINLIIINVYVFANANAINDNLNNWIPLSDSEIYMKINEEDIKNNFIELKIPYFSESISQDPLNLSVIFKNDNNFISQYKPIKVVSSKENYDIILKGNINFFLKNNISEMILFFNGNKKDFPINSYVDNEIKNKISSVFQNQKVIHNREKKYFNRISFGYNLTFLEPDFKNLNGINLNYIHGFQLGKIPLFIGLGVDVEYNFEKYINTYVYSSEYENKILHSLSVRIPLNLEYRIKLTDKFSIQPLVGLNFKVNPFFYYDHEDYKRYKDYSIKIWECSDGYVTYQYGWQIGLGFNISKLYIGFQYNKDYKKRETIMYDKDIYYYYDSFNSDSYRKYFDLKSSRFTVNLGLNF